MSEFAAPSSTEQSAPDSAQMEAPVKSRKGLIIGLSAVALAIAGLGAGTAAFSHHYAGRAMPGTTIAGQDVAGMDAAALTAFVTDKAAAANYTFTVDKDTVGATPKDMGLTFDVEQTVAQALAPSSSLVSQIRALFGTTEVAPVTSVDEDALSAFAEKLARKAGPLVQQASVKHKGEGEFEVTPAVVGKAVDTQALSADILKNASVFANDPVVAHVSDVEPSITDEDAQAAVADAKELAARDVTVTDGIDLFTAELATKTEWVEFPESADGKKLEAPRFNKDKVKKWVDQTAKDSNVESKPTYNNVDASGKVLIEGAMPGTKGYSVNNADKVLDGIMKSASAGEPYAGEFSYDEIEPRVENRQVLPGAENMAYPAAAGEKWLEINLGNNTVSAYVGTERVHGPVLIVPGSPGHETVTGLFHVYLKYEKQNMGCTPEWPYCAKDVPWVSYFHGSYAFHGAPWQDSFGWSGPGGSHGCINMPVSEARWVHEWSEMGTPVISHY